jgi:hypothetical protein
MLGVSGAQKRTSNYLKFCFFIESYGTVEITKRSRKRSRLQVNRRPRILLVRAAKGRSEPLFTKCRAVAFGMSRKSSCYCRPTADFRPKRSERQFGAQPKYRFSARRRMSGIGRLAKRNKTKSKCLILRRIRVNSASECNIRSVGCITLPKLKFWSRME